MVELKSFNELFPNGITDKYDVAHCVRSIKDGTLNPEVGKNSLKELVEGKLTWNPIESVEKKRRVKSNEKILVENTPEGEKKLTLYRLLPNGDPKFKTLGIKEDYIKRHINDLEKP